MTRYSSQKFYYIIGVAKFKAVSILKFENITVNIIEDKNSFIQVNIPKISSNA